VLSLLACSTQSNYTQSNFRDQRIAARPGCEGFLTNQVITRDGKLIIKYNISDAITRERLNESGFICHMNDRRFHICKDKPGICRVEHECLEWKNPLFAKKYCVKFKETYFDILKDYQKMLDGGLECYARDT
jgi:hypothetical protein